MASSSWSVKTPIPNGLHADFYYLLLDESWEEVNIFPGTPWVSRQDFQKRNSDNYGENELTEGLKDLHSAAINARSLILTNPSEFVFQLTSRVYSSTLSNKIVNMYVKCFLLYTEGPIVYPYTYMVHILNIMTTSLIRWVITDDIERIIMYKI